MSETTPNLGLRLLETGQAQKETDVNFNSTIVEALLAGVISRSVDTPPGSASEGDAYIMPAGSPSPSGVWAGHENEFSLYFGGVWNFLPPTIAGGHPVKVQDEGVYVEWDGGSPGAFVAILGGIVDETVQALGSVSGAQNIDLSVGQYITLTLDGAVTVTFSNPPMASRARGFTVEVTNPGGSPSGIITWPGSVEWSGGSAPDQTEGGTDVYAFFAIGSSRYVGAKAIENIS